MIFKQFIKSVFGNISKAHIRILGWSFFAAFFVTIVLPLFFFFYLFNPDDVRKLIVNQVNNEHYLVKIGGDIEPKTWHGLTLFIADTSIYDKHGNEIIHVNAANYQLSWPYLIIGKYKVRRIALSGVSFVKDGNYNQLINYDSFKSAEFNDLKYLSISSFKVLDAKTQLPILNDANIRISNLDKNPDLVANFLLPNMSTNVQISGDFIKQNSILNFDKLDIRASNGLNSIDAQSNAMVNLDSHSVIFNKFNSLLDFANYSGSLSVESGEISLKQANIGKVIGVIRNKSISNNNLNINLALSNVVTHDYHDYMSDIVNVNSSLTLNNHELTTSMSLNKFHFNDKLDISNQDIIINFNSTCTEASYFPNNIILKGIFSNNFESGLFSGDFDGTFEKLPLKFKLNYDYSGAVPKINFVGNLESVTMNNGEKDDNWLPMFKDNALISLDWINKIDLQAKLYIDQLSLYRLNLTNVVANLAINENGINIKQLTTNAYNGKIQANLQLNKVINGFELSTNAKITNVSLHRLFKNMFGVSAIVGTANVSMITVSKAISSYSDIYKHLTGYVLFTVANGGFNGVDFNLFLTPENLAAFAKPQNARTQFTQLSAKFPFKQGISESGIINFSSPTLKANGGGLIDFVHNKIDYNLLIQSNLPDNPHKISTVIIPTNVVGELFKPKIYIKNMKLNKAKK